MFFSFNISPARGEINVPAGTMILQVPDCSIRTCLSVRTGVLYADRSGLYDLACSTP